MSVLIKGMKMPKCCDDCDFVQHGIGDWCYITEKALPCDCPLIEIPDHGDLIDRDVLLAKVQKWYWEALETVKRMPTVIPAERSANGKES